MVASPKKSKKNKVEKTAEPEVDAIASLHALAAGATQFTPDDGRPTILAGADIHLVIDEAEQALAVVESVFKRGSQLVRVVADAGGKGGSCCPHQEA
jgi:hypothetical protein